MAVLSDQIKTESLNQQAFYAFNDIIAEIHWKVLFFQRSQVSKVALKLYCSLRRILLIFQFESVPRIQTHLPR